MVTHCSIILNADCLTSGLWPFTLTALTFGPCLYWANVSYFKDGWAVNFNFFPQRETQLTQLKHSPSKSQQWGQWEWMARLLKFLSFLAMIGKNIRQICQILLISLSFGKTQMNWLVIRNSETSTYCCAWKVIFLKSRNNHTLDDWSLPWSSTVNSIGAKGNIRCLFDPIHNKYEWP